MQFYPSYCLAGASPLFRLKLKTVGKTTRAFRYDLNQIRYDYTVEVTNRFKGLDLINTPVLLGFPGGSADKESTGNAGDLGLIPGLGRFPWRKERLPTPVFWPGEFHELYSP